MTPQVRLLVATHTPSAFKDYLTIRAQKEVELHLLHNSCFLITRSSRDGVHSAIYMVLVVYFGAWHFQAATPGLLLPDSVLYMHQLPGWCAVIWNHSRWIPYTEQFWRPSMLDKVDYLPWYSDLECNTRRLIELAFLGGPSIMVHAGKFLAHSITPLLKFFVPSPARKATLPFKIPTFCPAYLLPHPPVLLGVDSHRWITTFICLRWATLESRKLAPLVKFAGHAQRIRLCRLLQPGFPALRYPRILSRRCVQLSGILMSIELTCILSDFFSWLMPLA